MTNAQLKQKLKKNELSIGSWITIGHPSIIEVLSSAGFDWLTVDMEHTSIDYQSAQVLISTIQANDMAALVRVSKNEEVAIKRVLDAGADGVIIPMINSAEDAKRAVEYVKYPPEGKRGVGLYRAQKYGFGFETYKKWVDENVVIIAQIEHINGVNSIDEIITTRGIDGVMIGPYDLSGSIGIPGEYDSPEVIEVIEKVEDACKKYNIPLGFHVIQPDAELLKSKIENGYRFIAFSTDFLFMGIKAAGEMEKFK